MFGADLRNVPISGIASRLPASAHKKEQSRWLPTYLHRCLPTGGLLPAIAAFCEDVLTGPILSAALLRTAAIRKTGTGGRAGVATAVERLSRTTRQLSLSTYP